jgi:hypothetical protein
MGFCLFITQYLQTVDGDTALRARIGFLPITVVNFGVAMSVPRLTRRCENGPLLADGLALTLVEMAWLSRLSAGTSALAGHDCSPVASRSC